MRKSFIGILLAIASFVICFLANCSLKASCAFALANILIGLVNIHPKSDKQTKFLYCIWIIMLLAVGLFAQQFVLNESMLSLGFKRILLGMSCIAVIYLVMLLLTANIRSSVALCIFFVLLITTVNDAVYQFRGAELAPADILSIKTALNVAGQYSYQVSSPVVYAWIIGEIVVFSGWCLPKIQIKKRGMVRILSMPIALILMLGISYGGRNIQALHFLQTGSVANGYLLNFALQMRETFVTKPEDYSADQVADYASSVTDQENFNVSSDNPDIFVIMDESFADLSVLGSKIKTNEEVTPFIDSLTENTIRGYALSSVYGGGTPNSEYEFLTGNTLGFLPTGSIVYQQYIHDDSYSIVRNLSSLGYTTHATHPYLSSGWARTSVYPKLGFDSYSFEEDYPNKEFVRDFISDDEMFTYLIDRYENNSSGSKQFTFGVTMQNHSAYDYENDNFEEDIHVEGYSQDYPDVDQYLSLIHKTDQAMEKFITYLSTVDRPVVVVFYGDHLPNLNSKFYEEVHGGPLESLDDQQLEHTVPFFVWANYDIEEKNVGLTSINYLSTYMYEAANLSLPPYNQLLQKIQEEIPAINGLGYYSKSEGKFLKIQDATDKEKEALDEYNMLEYNCMFDKKERNSILFPVD